MILNQLTVEKLKSVVLEHKDSIQLPQANRWRSMSDNDIWISVMGQVGVVGSSLPAEKMTRSLSAETNWYESLIASREAERRDELHRVLRKFGIRYVSERADECRKTNALLKNISVLSSHGGPKEYLQRISRIADESSRVSAVIKDMAYIKNKGARDFLIGVGLIENAIAFDVRIKNVLVALGADLPDGVGSNRALYKQLESELIDKVCKPCGITGAVLDRVLYQKYREIT